MSNQYLPQLTKSPFVEVVSLCDIRPERAARQAERFQVANHYPHIDAMLAGVPFDFLVDTTDMQAHEALNRRGLEAGKHVWSEKPIANSLAAGQKLLQGAVLAAECLATGAPLLVTPEHAARARDHHGRARLVQDWQADRARLHVRLADRELRR